MQLGIFEKRSLIGVGLALLLFLGAVYEIGKRNLWFEPKTKYMTKVTDADGLRIGGYVTISGLRVGEISDLEVDQENLIAVTMDVKSSIAKRITEGSYVTIFRAFVIGEKRIELVPGDPDGKELKALALLPSKTTTELTDFISGKKLTELMTNVESLIAGLNGITKNVDQLFGKYHEGEFNNAIRLVEPSLENFIKLSDDLIVISKELKKQNKAIPEFVVSGNDVFKSIQNDFFKDNLLKQTLTTVNQTMTPFAQKQELISNMLTSLNDLAEQLKKNPDYASKVIEAVTELTITLKALQKTWLLEGKTEEVKKGK
jgi:phospholipid/cholesterol/gamma-HCH transport system substrate-binding protein